MAKFYIYALIDPTNNELFYIGQTTIRPHYRMINHLSAAKKSDSPVYTRIKDMISRGVRPIVYSLKRFESDLCTITNEKHGLYFEKIFIKEYSQLGTLLNIQCNPLYCTETKSFVEPKNRKTLQYKNGEYFIESDVIKYLHKEPYNPFKNHRFKAKMSQEEI